MTVYERDRAGSPLGSSHGRSRIFRRSYREVDYLRLSLRAIEEWRRPRPVPAARRRGSWSTARASSCTPLRWTRSARRTSGSSRPRPNGASPRPASRSGRCGTPRPARSWPTTRCGPSPRASTSARACCVDDPRELEADVIVACPGSWLGPMFGLPLQPRIEQVTYFAGAPDDRPSVIDHGAPDRRLHYGLIAPGVGLQDRRGRRPARPVGCRPLRPPGRRASRRPARRAREADVPRPRPAAPCTRSPASTRCRPTATSSSIGSTA